MSYLSTLICVSALDDFAEASGPLEAGGVLPGNEQDDMSEPGCVLWPSATQPASGGVLPHQPRLHRLRGARKRPALQKAH